MSDTPRTDAILEIASIEDRYIPLRDLSRQLERDLAAREEELAEARDALQFVERWANYHGVKPTCTAKAALSAIQHYPPIREITESYKDGKIPETRNPWEELSAATDRAEKAEAERDALRRDAERWRTCLDSVGVAVSIFNVDPAGWRYPESEHLVAAIDNIIEGNENAWKVPVDTGGAPLRAPFELNAQSRESVEARFYRYLRDESGGNEDNDGPMICAGFGDQFDFLRGEECDKAIRQAIDARAAIDAAKGE